MAIGNVDTDANGNGGDHTGHGILTRQITGVAAGTDLTDAVNVAQLKAAVAQFSGGGSGTGGSGVHDYSVKSVKPDTDTNYNNKGATGDNALAAGVSASATGAHSVAVGNGAQAVGQDSIALGTNAKADGIGATAIGQYNTASGQNSLAFGGGYNKDQKGNTASGVASVAFGEGTQAIAEGTLAFGENTQAGSTEKDNQGNLLGQNAVAFGNGTKATGGRSLAFGERTVASANDATAFGNESIASKTGATAFGNKNQATGQYATAWGGGDKTVDNGNGTTSKIGTVASGLYATAFGERTEARGESATAFGSDSIASGKDSLAFGTGSTASGNNSLAGLGGTATTANSIALGKNTKANNKDNAVSVAIGENAEASGARSLAIGFGVKGKVTEGGVEKDDTTLTQTTASGESAVSIGTDTQAAGQHSIAFGSHTQATKDSSLAIGYDTHATEASAVAIGSGTKVNRGYGVAIGLSALAGIDESDPDSKRATSFDGAQTVAVGYYARATATNAAALGAATSANINGGVALGYGSATTRAAGNKVNGMEQKAYLKPASVDSTNNSTWTSTAGAVSVGNVGAKQSITRQITDVAAGSKDTDAVNVAQLKQAGFTVTANTDATAGSSIKTGETLDFKAEDNAIVSTTKDSKTITVKVSKTPTFDSVTTGDTVINNKGLTVGEKTYVSNAGLNANNQFITNVANGKADNDAVNVSQLKNSRTMVTSSDQSIQVADTANGNPNHAYDIKVDYGKVADNTSISYKANGGTAQSVTLKNGLNFTNGANTTAEVGADGVVKVNATDMRVQSGTATYSDDGNGSISMTHHDGTTATISGLKDTYTRSASYDAANKKATFTRNDNTTYDLDLSAIANEAGNGKLNFKGDDETVISKKLNDTLTIKGGQTDASKLSDGKNVGVINEKGALRIELAKKIDLGEDGSVKMGDTTINNNGLTIKNGPTITKTNVSMNNQQIHNVAAGKKGTDAVNVDQLNEVQTLASKHTKVTVEGGTAPKGQTYVGKNLKINVTNSNGQETYDLKLADNLSIGEKGADGKDGKIGVNGKDGSSVVINGKDGTIGLNGKNGTNGLTIRGAAGKPGVDGKDGITRIVYKDASGKDHPVATLDDGLKFK